MMFDKLLDTDARGHYVDEDIRLTLVGLDKAQGKRLRSDANNDRLYLPAAIPLRLLRECGPRLAALARLSRSELITTAAAAVADCRADLAVCFGYADFGRGQSQSAFTVGDVVFDSAGDLLWQFRVWKGSTKHKHNLTFRWPADSNPLLLAALRDWFALCATLAAGKQQHVHKQLWRLPWEGKPLTSSSFDGFLSGALKRRGLSAPPGFVYTGHSARAGSLSEANALGVPIVTLRHMGGFAVGSRVPEATYIDPSCPPSPAGVIFFGWLRPFPLSPGLRFGNSDSEIPLPTTTTTTVPRLEASRRPV
jgi:hypothetical protein